MNPSRIIGWVLASVVLAGCGQTRYEKAVEQWKFNQEWVSRSECFDTCLAFLRRGEEMPWEDTRTCVCDTTCYDNHPLPKWCQPSGKIPLEEFMFKNRPPNPRDFQ